MVKKLLIIQCVNAFTLQNRVNSSNVMVVGVIIMIVIISVNRVNGYPKIIEYFYVVLILIINAVNVAVLQLNSYIMLL